MNIKRLYVVIITIFLLFSCGLFCIDLQNFDNGQSFGSVRSKINTNNDSLEVYIDSLINKTQTTIAFATLFDASQTLLDSSYTAITGAFNNVIAENFTVVTSGENSPYLQYIGTQTITIEVNSTINFGVQFASIVKFALRLGDGDFIVDPNSEVVRSVASNTGIASLPGYYMGQIQPMDKIQIVVKTNRPGGNSITGLNMQVGITRVK